MKQNSTCYLLVLFLLAISITACQDQNASSTGESKKDTTAFFDLNAVKSQIQSQNELFGKAVVTGDTIALVDHYTDDARIFPPNMQPVEGRTAIAALMSQVVKYGIGEYRDETVRVYGNPDNVIEEGNYFMKDGKGTTIDQGKYLCVWRNDKGTWKIYSNMYNSNNPPATAK